LTPARVLVVGRTGQLALSLAERAAAQGVPLSFAARPELDLTEPHSIHRTVRESGASVIVNAAAYTAVDQAESEQDLAHQVNGVAPGVLADAAAKAGAHLIHLSTDYVFAGDRDRPYREEDPVAPATAYGRSKLAGERAVQERLGNYAILRTAWVYSPFGKNFVKTMLGLAETRSELRVVGDQIGNPTSALDLADGIFRVISAWQDEPGRGTGNIYHLAGTGSTSWADFARETFAQSRVLGGPSAEVTAISSAEWPVHAQRPLNSRLDSSLFAQTFGYSAPPWQRSLAEVILRLLPHPAERL
jgi:dTDP-4-dehydrorhamnose reductase